MMAPPTWPLAAQSMGYPLLMIRRVNLLLALRAFGQWAFLGVLIGAIAGAASGAFLALLERATAFRDQHLAIVYALPVAGLLMGWALDRWGKPIRGGNNLVIDTAHEDSPQIPIRMAPIALLGTVYTHLFGGSAGREGTVETIFRVRQAKLGQRGGRNDLKLWEAACG
jgi:H+/Cl- antiporter ClcA